MTGFADQAYAMQFRDVVSRVVQDVLARTRPPSRYATVLAFNRSANSAQVIFAGESIAVAVRMSDGVQPTAAGQVVRIDGTPGNFYVAEVVSGLVYRHRETNLLQWSMTGGGVISWDGATLGWSQRFLVLGSGLSYEMAEGYFSILQPASSQIVHGHGGRADVLATAAGIPFGPNDVLYYEPPDDGSSDSQDTNFHILDYHTEFEVPNNWLFIAAHQSDVGSPSLKLGTGAQIDHWRAPTLTGSWINYGSIFNPAGYRITADRSVILRGLVKNGLQGVGNPIFTLPVGYRPANTYIFQIVSNTMTETSGAASAGTAHTHSIPISPGPVRLDVQGNGIVYVNDARTSNLYLSLDGIRFAAEQ